MATKKRAKRAAKKTPAQGQDSPFFRPFADLAKKRKEEEKADKAAKPDKPAQGEAKKKPAPRAAPQPAPPPVDPVAEAESFAMYMAGVRALEAGKARIPLSASRIERAERSAKPSVDLDADARAQLHSLVAEGVRFEVTDDGERIEGRRIDVDPRELRRLRRGAYTIDGRLDLHGMSAGEARLAVEKFVRKKRSDGDRVVALIHGRGNHSPRGIAVLRGEIAAWLSQGPAAHHVAAFASAPPEDGGAGVVLALLAR
jgi:DNA-nicking Smr family endonuclease